LRGTMTQEVLKWLRERSGSDGVVSVTRKDLEAAGLPERFIRRMSSRFKELEQAGRLEILERAKEGDVTRYTLRLASGGVGRVPRGKHSATAGTGVAPAPSVNLVLRLSGVPGRVRLEELSVDLREIPAGEDGTGNMLRTLEKYEEQGRRLVENALRMQQVIESWERERERLLKEVDWLKTELLSLRSRVEGSERPLRSGMGRRERAQPEVRLEEIFTEP